MESSMSKMAELHLEITERLSDGATPEAIAEALQVPLDWVLSMLQSA